MADFVAVIRRAVDGLANNTPEMRLRVYDKARGAVQRQLENMKPRPSDDMLRRQMDKLEAAILSVEAEHAEALPGSEPDVAPVAAAAAFAPAVADPPRDEEQTAVATQQDDAASSYSDLAYEHDERGRESYEPADRDEPTAREPADDEPAGYAPPSYEPVAYEPAAHEPDAPEPAPYEPAAYEPPSYEPPAYEPSVPEPDARQATDFDRAAGDDADRYDMPVEPVARHEDDPAPAAPVFADGGHAAPWETERWDEPVAPVSAPYPDEPPFAHAETTRAVEDDQDRLIPSPEPTFPQQVPVWPEDPASPHPLADDTLEPLSGGERGTHSAQSRLVEPMAEFDAVPHRSQEPTWLSAQEPSVPADEAPSVPAWTDPVELPRHDETARPDASAPAFDDRFAAESFDAHFETPVSAAATAKMPAVADLPAFGAASAPDYSGGHDPFEEYLREQPGPVSATDVATAGAAGGFAGAAAAQPAKSADPDPWNDLEELIGYNKAAAAEAEKAPAASDDELHDDMMPPPVRPYRAQPKPKRRFGPVILAVLGLVILGGGGYLAWSNWDKVDEMIGSLGGTDTTGTDTAQQTPSTTTTPPPASQTPPAGQTDEMASQAPANGQAASTATPPAADGTAAGQKFTQRLMANGTEIDEGAGGPQATGGGQSVAQLNSPPGTPATTPAEAGADAPATAPAVNPTETAAVSGEKMFLYEERLGQPAPTAVEGNVSWSLQNEPGENGRQEPTVQARINIPGRGLTALVTFKRNSDASLPASHLIELVFSVPPDFEGGAIDSVQRIAMKDTEQDRGTPLVAVPAKITDDFHMIALNDFPDARATNLELLRSKNWLDIPLAYRNGRRALLTLQKGPEGVRAFDTAIRQWSTATASSGQ